MNNGMVAEELLNTRIKPTKRKRISQIRNYTKRGCFVISDFTIWGYLMQKDKKKHKKVCLNAK
jgi:hypothetical protein